MWLSLWLKTWMYFCTDIISKRPSPPGNQFKLFLICVCALETTQKPTYFFLFLFIQYCNIFNIKINFHQHICLWHFFFCCPLIKLFILCRKTSSLFHWEGSRSSSSDMIESLVPGFPKKESLHPHRWAFGYFLTARLHKKSTFLTTFSASEVSAVFPEVRHWISGWPLHQETVECSFSNDRFQALSWRKRGPHVGRSCSSSVSCHQAANQKTLQKVKIEQSKNC